MFWDGLFVLTAAILAVNGWTRGLTNSWRGPIAIVIATFVSREFYIDFAAWITFRLHIATDAGIIIAYLMIWLSSKAMIEIAISMIIRSYARHEPIFFNRLSGAAYGLGQTFLIFVLPIMASSSANHIATPPPDLSGLQFPPFTATDSSLLIPGFNQLAKALLPSLGPFVVSNKMPSFEPTFDSPSQPGQTKEDDPETDRS